VKRGWHHFDLSFLAANRMSTENPSPQNSSPKLTDVEQDVITVIPSENSPTNQQPSAPTSTSQENLQTQVADSPPATTRPPCRSPPPGTINMSSLRTALPDITLNSPATNIIGTPFAHTASNTPFEYPFPDTESTDSTSPPLSHPSFRPGNDPHRSTDKF